MVVTMELLVESAKIAVNYNSMAKVDKVTVSICGVKHERSALVPATLPLNIFS